MTSGRLDGQRSMGSLLRDLAEGSATLVKNEVRLARLEVSTMLRAVGTGTAEIAVGGVLALLGVLAFFTGLVLLPGDQWLRDQYWLAALIVTLVAGGVAAWFAKQGLALLSPQRLAPDETIASLKEDKEWLKHPLT
jgi:Putative Actinobacterial Holin-X, holin superfamily III